MEQFLTTTTEVRRKMNLPDFYVEQMLEGHLDTSNLNESALVSIMGSDAPIDQKVFSGMVLSLIGHKLGSSKADFISIPSKTVGMGSDQGEIDMTLTEFSHLGLDSKWLEKERPRHSVAIEAFNISKYPVTNADYLEFLKETQYPEIPTSWYAGRYPKEQANNPVSSVGPRSAKAYCRWRTKKTGRKTRLPTEFEWELAAGGGIRRYPWGNTYEVGKANLADLNMGTTTPVGTFLDSASFFGCVDMAGNVEEWTSSPYEAYPGGELVRDWFYEKQNDYLITRGGSWNLNGDCARVFRRHASGDAAVCGFRIVQEI